VRVRIPKAAAVELAARYRARAEAERRLVDFLAGVALARGVKLEDVEGFDDVTGELLLKDKP
jgi:seryl-tRNA synthetase